MGISLSAVSAPIHMLIYIYNSEQDISCDQRKVTIFSVTTIVSYLA